MSREFRNQISQICVIIEPIVSANKMSKSEQAAGFVIQFMLINMG